MHRQAFIKIRFILELYVLSLNTNPEIKDPILDSEWSEKCVVSHLIFFTLILENEICGRKLPPNEVWDNFKYILHYVSV